MAPQRRAVWKLPFFPSMFKPRQAQTAAPATPPAIEVVRRRAKHRLIGASVLVLVAVLVFPVLFDTQPRPIPVDIPIEIPSRQTTKPLDKVAVAAPTSVGPGRSLSPREDLVDAPVKPAAPVEVPPKAVAEPAHSDPDPVADVPDPEPTAKKTSAPALAPSVKESARAQALLEGRDEPAATANAERFIVQVGAFADAALAQQTRLKLERAGLKTYTHVATTPDGKRTRVRMGPFTSRGEADKAAAKAKGLGITVAILTL